MLLVNPLTTRSKLIFDNSYNISSENLVLNQLIIPKLIFCFILITYLVDIVLIIIVRRNSVSVTHGSYRVK